MLPSRSVVNSVRVSDVVATRLTSKKAAAILGRLQVSRACAYTSIALRAAHLQSSQAGLAFANPPLAETEFATRLHRARASRRPKKTSLGIRLEPGLSRRGGRGREMIRAAHFASRKLVRHSFSDGGRGIRKNPASQAADVTASGVALYKYTRKPENAADAPESPEIFRTKCGVQIPVI